MKRRTINSQLGNYKTYLAYRNKMLTLAMNVFQFKNMNPFIDMAYVNSNLVLRGSIAFFKDEVMGLLALPYTPVGSLDIYGRPTAIKVLPKNGSYNRTLRKGEFVIMYDNESKLPIWDSIVQSCERIAEIKRTIDINISQQATPRYWKTSESNVKTVETMLRDIDSKVDAIVTSDNNIIDDITCCLAPAPYVADKLNEAKKEEWAEFLELIGISNVAIQKKERVIRDEILTSMGGTIASRYSRFTSRAKAIEDINKKFDQNIEVSFYDGLPTTIEDVDEFLNDKNNENDEEVDENVSNESTISTE